MKETTNRVYDAKFRLANLTQDLLMVEEKRKRLAAERADLILKLVATREAILSENEQDE